MAAAGNLNGPTGLREGGFILQRGTHSDRPRISGGGDAGFRDAGMWQKQNTPHPSTPPLPGCGRKGVQGHCAPDFSVPHSSVRSRVAYPSTGEKQDLKTLYFCVFSVKDHQRAPCYGGEGKQQDGERINATEANCLPLRRAACRKP